MESWRYKQSEGMIEGPVSSDQLRELYNTGKITLDTSVRSTASGGEWKRFGDARELWPRGAISRMPSTVTRLWPLFLLGIPIIGGLMDVAICQSRGNATVEAAAPWLIHAPVALMLTATIIWIFLIVQENRKIAPQAPSSGLLVWLLAVPFYMSWLWWVTPTVTSAVNLTAGLDFPTCESDVSRGQVLSLFPEAAARAGHPGLTAASLSGVSQQLATDRIRICTGKVTAGEQAYPVRFKIEDRGNTMFHNSLRGLHVTMVLE
ncbi:GYF domain-containing protein [Methylocapsa palsarum]|uniref:Uncharacterized protein n=1 Tax=Methylocapsa palsarum TaxID=1612308 RepID=A0A1I4AJI5_9HYPH|nr:GYF domain-containing protein [Methylocapsa palsarum]SFK56091.1 hypothetical protein SAMN05444581_110118 [Methylocapsa palsarum]